MASSDVVLESAEFVVSHSQDVSIPSEGIESLANIVRPLLQTIALKMAISYENT
jgi:hypothetical protein